MEKSYSRQQMDADRKTKRADRGYTGLIKPGSEDHTQMLFFAWADSMVAEQPLLALAFSIPNGSAKSRAQAAVMQMTGLRSGVPDVCVPVGPPHPTLWIEFKSVTGRTSPEQRIWIARLTAIGDEVVVMRTWWEAANKVMGHLKMESRPFTQDTADLWLVKNGLSRA